MAYNRGIYVNENGTWVPVSAPKVNVNGTWVSVKKGFVNVNGIWKQMFPSNGAETFLYPGTFHFTVPPGITQLSIDAAGGGGGGGGATAVGVLAAGGGGGSGGYVQGRTFAVTPGETLTLSIGQGGNGAVKAPYPTNTATSGSPGSDTVITGRASSLILSGGAGGIGGSYIYPGAGGSGGTPNGVIGMPGFTPTNTHLVPGGTGGTTPFGVPGAGGTPASAYTGLDGTYGTGGGGGTAVSALPIVNWGGGSGGAGYVKIYWGPGSDPNYV